MAASGQFDPFPPPRLNGTYPFSKPTFAGASAKEKVVPIPDLPTVAPELGGSTHNGRSAFTVGTALHAPPGIADCQPHRLSRVDAVVRSGALA
jgi:hypothetical protein